VPSAGAVWRPPQRVRPHLRAGAGAEVGRSEEISTAQEGAPMAASVVTSLAPFPTCLCSPRCRRLHHSALPPFLTICTAVQTLAAGAQSSRRRRTDSATLSARSRRASPSPNTPRRTMNTCPRLRSGGGPRGWSRQPAAARRRQQPPAGDCSSAHEAALAGDGAGFKGSYQTGHAGGHGSLGRRRRSRKNLMRCRRRWSVWGRGPVSAP